MKTGKAFFGWVIMASLFVAVGTMFAPKNTSYRIKRLVEKGKRFLGVRDPSMAKPDLLKTASEGRP